MSQAPSRPNLRSRKRTETTTTAQKGTRKRKARPSITEDDYKVNKKNISKTKVIEEMKLESDEVLLDCLSSNEKTNHIESPIKSHINTNIPDKRRKTNRRQNNNMNNTKPKCCFRPHTPTELINEMNNVTFSSYFTPTTKNISPLPQLSWADCDEVWETMLQRDKDYQRDSLYIRKHPSLQPRMRAVLLDWLIEVCEVYRLHRETFYLAVDFVDRYLSSQRNIAKTRLQLVGVTSLFVAAKIEEIYPPKLSEFAYVTDGACTVDEILLQESNLLKELKWRLSPVTPIAWLTSYLQITNRKLSGCCKENIDESFDMPQFSGIHLCRISELIDICCLDTGYLQFSYSVIAASALYHMWGKDTSDITGHKINELFPCIQWLAPFAHVLHMQSIKPIKIFEKIAADDAHNIQCHNNGISLLDEAHEHLSSILPVNNLHLSTSIVQCKGILTPPKSTEKDLFV